MHFRHHIKREHNALIVGEDENNYDYFLVTSSPKRDKNHKNEKFDDKPNKKYNGNSYFDKRLKKDLKDYFGINPIKTWHLSERDFKKIISILNKKN